MAGETTGLEGQQAGRNPFSCEESLGAQALGEGATILFFLQLQHCMFHCASAAGTHAPALWNFPPEDPNDGGAGSSLCAFEVENGLGLKCTFSKYIILYFLYLAVHWCWIKFFEMGRLVRSVATCRVARKRTEQPSGKVCAGFGNGVACVESPGSDSCR